MNARWGLWIAMWLLLPAVVRGQSTPVPGGHPQLPCYCPTFSLSIIPNPTNKIITCLSNDVEVCVVVDQEAGMCAGQIFHYNTSDLEYHWEVQGVVAVPSSGKTPCARFRVLSGGRGEIKFSVTGSRDNPTDCYQRESISRTFDVIVPDIDVDSDNTSGTGLPAGSTYEDSIEVEAGLPGKIIGVNLGDVDNDGVPNFADGYDIFNNQGINAGGTFTPMVIRLPFPIDLSVATIRFDYNAAAPGAVTRTGDGTVAHPYLYKPGSQGALRLWRTAGSASRKKADVAAGGDYVVPYKSYRISEVRGGNVFALFIEGINPSMGMADQFISVSIDPDGDGTAFDWMCGDAVRVTLVAAQTGVDADRNRVVSFGDADQTAPIRPYRFWLNNDRDKGSDDEAEDLDPSEGTKDAEDNVIKCMRDLEDLAPLGFRVSGPSFVYDQLRDGTIRANILFRHATNSPSMTLFRSAEQNSEFKYLTDAKAAGEQMSRHIYTNALGSAHGYIFPIGLGELIDTLNPSKPNLFTLFEGRTAGKAQVILQLKINNYVVIESSPTYLELKDIKAMYEHFTVGDTTDRNPADIPSVATETNNFSYSATDPETDDYVLFVHGWRMKTWERRYFAETAYKRLFWAGYRGKFGFFSWPTEWVERPWTEPGNYDRSEYKAWRSAPGLRNVLVDLNAKYPGRVRMLAHSMGNIVASEALRIEAETTAPRRIVHTYVASQAASVADAYDATVDNRPTGADTPEVYGHYPPTGQRYYLGISRAVGSIQNFHSSVDYALGMWRINQDMKPDLYYDYEYVGFDFSQKRWTYDPWGWTYEILDFPADTYRIYSFIADAWSYSLGSEGATGGEISQPFDLHGNPLGFGDGSHEHSAQFLATTTKRILYWTEALNVMRLKSP